MSMEQQLASMDPQQREDIMGTAWAILDTSIDLETTAFLMVCLCEMVGDVNLDATLDVARRMN